MFRRIPNDDMLAYILGVTERGGVIFHVALGLTKIC